jgi:hypothetical protein
LGRFFFEQTFRRGLSLRTLDNAGDNSAQALYGRRKWLPYKGTASGAAFLPSAAAAAAGLL